jgi:hypothetical protein
VGAAWQAVGFNLYGDDEVEADQAEVCKVLPGQAAGFQMGVNKAEAPEVPRGKAVEAKVRDENAAPVTDEDVGDLSPSVHEETELPVGLPGQLGQPPYRFRWHDLTSPWFGPAETLDAPDLVTPQAGGFAFNFSDCRLQKSGITLRQAQGRVYKISIQES